MERWRERDRKMEGWRERATEKQRDRETDRQTYRELGYDTVCPHTLDRFKGSADLGLLVAV